MFSKINHVAIVSERYALLGKFYESVFGMKASGTKNPARAITVGDGYVGLNINPRKAIRTMRPDEMAKFYVDVFELSPQNRPAGDPNHYLSDGKVTLMIMPWKITNYADQSILTPGMDHVGFTVENMDKFKEDLDEVVGVNPVMSPIPVGKGKESGNRLELLKQQCPIGEYFISDP